LQLRKREIKFLALDGVINETIDPPVKASKALPQWVQSLRGNSDAKRCLPLVEACTEGYVWKTHCDIAFEVTEKGLTYTTGSDDNNYQFSKSMPVISTHNDGQVYSELDNTRENAEKNHGPINWKTVFKLANLFVIRTPKGYSTRFKSLSNVFNLPFQMFEGVVETDKYYNAINFPFRYTGPEEPHTYILQRGTPLIQLIPFKREKWKSSIGVVEPKQMQKNIFRSNTVLKDYYRNLVRGKYGDT
tara:strand:- start:279 stop:1013 length:735 start_codon:yes stop_codon:yes gene_type:complete